MRQPCCCAHAACSEVQTLQQVKGKQVDCQQDRPCHTPCMPCMGLWQTQSCSNEWAGHSLRQLLIWILPAPAL